VGDAQRCPSGIAVEGTRGWGPRRKGRFSGTIQVRGRKERLEGKERKRPVVSTTWHNQIGTLQRLYRRAGEGRGLGTGLSGRKKYGVPVVVKSHAEGELLYIIGDREEEIGTEGPLSANLIGGS